MKELDKNKVYDLSNLNDDELYKVAEYVYQNKHKFQVMECTEDTIEWFSKNKGRYLSYEYNYDCKCWGFFDTEKPITDAKELFTEWTPKQGEKVLVKNNGNEYREREFICITSDGKYLCWYEDKKNALPFIYIKPFEEDKIKVGDWVKSKNGNIYKFQKGLLFDDHSKITNPELIKLLEQEIK